MKTLFAVTSLFLILGLSITARSQERSDAEKAKLAAFKNRFRFAVSSI